MAQITKGFTAATGVVLAGDFNDAFDDAVLAPGAVSEQTEKAHPAGTDVLMFLDSATGELARTALQNLLHNVGDVKVGFWATLPTGWLWANGETIGNASSGGTQRANADTEALFTELWNAIGNTELPIEDSSGAPSSRGASAAADFAADKRLPVPDLRERVIAGCGTMGTATTPSRLTSAASGMDGGTLGAAGGLETLMAHLHAMGGLTVTALNYQQDAAVTGAGARLQSISLSNGTTYNSGTPSGLTGNTASTGTGSGHGNVQPTILAGAIIKF